MDKQFHTEVRKASETEYIKIFCHDIYDLEKVRDFLSLDTSHIKKVNISNGKDLTVQPTAFYSAQEVKEHIDASLNHFYKHLYTLGEVPFNEEELKCKYEKSLALYQDGLSKINNPNTLRNGLDDLRLSMELFLKDLLKNDAPLEKQSNNLKNWLTQKGASTEIRNMIVDYIFRWSKYQNLNVKHDSKCRDVEILFIVGLSNLIINQLLKYDKMP